MNNWRLNLRSAFAVWLIAAAALFIPRVHAADSKSDASSLAGSAPLASSVGTNSSSATRKDGLKQLEDDIFKPFKKSLSPESSLDAVLTPPQTRLSSRRQAPQSKKEKEQEAERREWVFLSADELATGPSMEEVFNLPEYGPDGMVKKKLSPMERYLERLEGKNSSETNGSNKARDPNRYRASEQQASSEEVDVLARTKESKTDEDSIDRVQKLFSGRSDDTPLGSSAHHGTVADIFGLGDSSKSSPDLTKAQKGRLDEFKAMIGFSSPGPSSSPFGSDVFSSPKSAADSSAKFSNPFGASDSFGSRASSFDSGWGKINAGPASSGLSDFGSKSFGSSPFNPPAPVQSQPATVAPALPNFAVPKRAF